jgi:hypothetical protein
MMEVVYVPETLVMIYKTTRYQNSEDNNPCWDIILVLWYIATFYIQMHFYTFSYQQFMVLVCHLIGLSCVFFVNCFFLDVLHISLYLLLIVLLMLMYFYCACKNVVNLDICMQWKLITK